MSSVDRFLCWTLLLTLAACSGPQAPPPEPIGVSRQVGSWQGRGNQTLGFLSESGRLRVTWQTRNEGDADGAFRLTLHSAVSGRLLHVIAEHEGPGAATVPVEDDPRPYNFMVEATGVEWAISVEETVASTRPAGGDQ